MTPSGVVSARGAMLGYCTNVHAGPSLEETRANLQEHALAVKSRVSPDDPMGIGLWLSNVAVAALAEGREVRAFGAWLAERGLLPFTFNGFPYADFHRQVVKHRVYDPDWTSEERLTYTLALARVQAGLLGDLPEGSISTLPIGWGSRFAGRDDAKALAARQLARAVDALAGIEDETGKWIHLDLEPEPGCVLERSHDVVEWFEQYLLPAGDESRIRRHLRVCHDVCHHAVMFEDQARVLRRYRERGIGVGKIQLSSALRVPFADMEAEAADRALTTLREFAEERYLHQTVIREAGSAQARFFDDLPTALDDLGPNRPAGEWRVHYHVPLYLQQIGELSTTASEIVELLSLDELVDVRHFEVETYAWDVLPGSLRQRELAIGIARELEWVQDPCR